MATDLQQWLLGAVAFGIGLLWLSSAAMKLRHWVAFRGVVSAYRLLPDGMVAPSAIALPILEALVGVALLTGIAANFAAIVAAFLFVVFGLAMGINLRRGRSSIDCGCFQSTLKQSLQWRLVWRSLAFALLSVGTATTSPPPASWETLLTVVPAGTALFVLHLALDHVWALDTSRRRALERLPT